MIDAFKLLTKCYRSALGTHVGYRNWNLLARRGYLPPKTFNRRSLQWNVFCFHSPISANDSGISLRHGQLLRYFTHLVKLPPSSFKKAKVHYNADPTLVFSNVDADQLIHTLARQRMLPLAHHLSFKCPHYVWELKWSHPDPRGATWQPLEVQVGPQVGPHGIHLEIEFL